MDSENYFASETDGDNVKFERASIYFLCFIQVLGVIIFKM